MAITNLKTGLLRKYARWCGELIQLDKDVIRIEAEYQTLDEKRDRLAKLKSLQDAACVLMSELDPKWKPEDTQPMLTNKQHLPWEHGSTTRTAFAIIRDLSSPVSTLELSKLTIAKLGQDPSDADLLDRVRSNLDNSLRSAKDFIRNTGGRPSRWEIIPIDEQENDPLRPSI